MDTTHPELNYLPKILTWEALAKSLVRLKQANNPVLCDLPHLNDNTFWHLLSKEIAKDYTSQKPQQATLGATVTATAPTTSTTTNTPAASTSPPRTVPAASGINVGSGGIVSAIKKTIQAKDSAEAKSV